MASFGITELDDLQNKSADYLNSKIEKYTAEYNRAVEKLGAGSDQAHLFKNEIQVHTRALSLIENKSKAVGEGNSNPLPQSRSR